jgi:hypothetical protein
MASENAPPKYASSRPLQVTDIVLPGDRHEIHDAYSFI